MVAGPVDSPLLELPLELVVPSLNIVVPLLVAVVSGPVKIVELTVEEELEGKSATVVVRLCAVVKLVVSSFEVVVSWLVVAVPVEIVVLTVEEELEGKSVTVVKGLCVVAVGLDTVELVEFSALEEIPVLAITVLFWKSDVMVLEF